MIANSLFVLLYRTTKKVLGIGVLDRVVDACACATDAVAVNALKHAQRFASFCFAISWASACACA
jgi:hypothetical protein